MLSRRCDWNLTANPISVAVEQRRATGRSIIDLTETNPTRVGLSYPDDQLAELLSRSSGSSYSPEAAGLFSAREAIAEALSRSGNHVSAGDLILTASTSEAYSHLFKLLMNSGDSVLAPVPSYPLLEHLAALDNVVLRHFPLQISPIPTSLFRSDSRSRWEVDFAAVEECVDQTTRALVIVDPNNPTGSFLRRYEQDNLAEICRRHGMALISDEVFADYPLQAIDDRAQPASSRTDVLSFSLGGLSKRAGLPHWKLGWICVGGPAHLKHQALKALELIGDTYLSVATPVQVAMKELLQLGEVIHAEIHDRIRKNAETLERETRELSFAEMLPVEAGWSAVLRVPRIMDDEQMVLALLEGEGVLIHPGYFFDFKTDGFLVLSLLPDEKTFEDGLAAIRRFLTRLFAE